MSNIKYDDTDYLINREESIEYKISDTNVASIEEDIERCEQLIKPEHANWIGISNQLAIAGVLARIEELEEETKKYIVQLTDEQYRNLVETIRKEAKKEYEQRIKDKIEKLKDTAKRIAGTYQYADSGDDLLEKKNRVIELRNKAEALENFLGG